MNYHELTPIPARQMVEGDLYASDGRVRCAHCYSDKVQYSLPAWFDPNRGNRQVDVDAEATPAVYCEACGDGLDGWHNLIGLGL